MSSRLRLGKTSEALDFIVHLGASGQYSREPTFAVTTDMSGAIYVTGYAQSADFPTTPGVVQPELRGFQDVYVAKLSADATELVWATFLGGSSGETPRSIAVDASGAAFVTGVTYSGDFPTTAHAFQETFHGDPGVDFNIFVTKISPDGTTLEYSTLVAGATGNDNVNDLALDATGCAIIVGTARNETFPTTPGAFHSGRNTFGFVTKLSLDGNNLVFSALIGGSFATEVIGVAVDATGIVLAGGTTASDFPVMNAIDDTLDGGQDAFVSKLSLDGSHLLFSTFLGGSGSDSAFAGVVLDRDGDVIVGGLTSSADFPTTPGAFQTTINDASTLDAGFVTRISGDGGTVRFSTYLGGRYTTQALSLAVETDGSVFVAGLTESDQYPVTDDALDSTLSGYHDGFLSQLDRNGETMVYSTYLGGDDTDNAFGVALDGFGGAIVCGDTHSSDFAPTGFGPNEGGSGFVAKFVNRPRMFELRSIDPSSAPRKAKLDVVIRGDLFEDGSTVNFGAGIKVRSVAVVSATEIHVRIKVTKRAALGHRDVVVTNRAGETASGGFEITE